MVAWVISWFIVLVTLISIEVATADLLTIWFMPAAVVCIVLAAFNVSVPIQIVVFFVLSIIAVVLYKTVLKKFIMAKKKSRTNISLVIGEMGVVQEKIDNFAGTGLVKVKSQLWSARSDDDSVVFQIGDFVEVVSVEGVKLVCEKSEKK